MAVRVGINGFGRIGRNVLRAATMAKDVAGRAVDKGKEAATAAGKKAQEAGKKLKDAGK